jgi:hypothetical protein
MGGKYANVLETIGRTPVIRSNRAPGLLWKVGSRF